MFGFKSKCRYIKYLSNSECEIKSLDINDNKKHNNDNDDLIECRNFDYCKNKMKFWILKDYKGLCDECYIQMGDHYLTNNIMECPICLNDLEMVKLKCNHEICNNCWYEISLAATLDETKNFVPECPLCRGKN